MPEHSLSIHGTYEITGKGFEAYREELKRLKQCVIDAEGGM